jgi:hypothetical protein
MLLKNWKCVIAAAVVLAASIGAVRADVIVDIQNPSFESPTPLTDTDDEYGLKATPTSWTKVMANDIGLFDLSMTGGPAPHVSSIPDGAQAVWGNSDNVDTNYVYQTLDATLQANTTYTLTAYAGARDDLGFTQYGAQAAGTIELGYGSDYGVNRLTADSSNCPVPANGTWALWTKTFTTGANPAGLGESLRVEINVNAVQQLFDNMQLTASTVPEPAAIWLLATGLFGLLAYAWRKQN